MLRNRPGGTATPWRSTVSGRDYDPSVKQDLTPLPWHGKIKPSLKTGIEISNFISPAYFPDDFPKNSFRKIPMEGLPRKVHGSDVTLKAGGAGLIPGPGDKIPHVSWPKNQNIKQKQYGNKFNNGF